uniref:Secreted protein n=1 Tax=Anguilla anguilla TaxID=7936 RepID=A0A0E9W806_ANGAN
MTTLVASAVRCAFVDLLLQLIRVGTECLGRVPHVLENYLCFLAALSSVHVPPPSPPLSGSLLYANILYIIITNFKKKCAFRKVCWCKSG